MGVEGARGVDLGGKSDVWLSTQVRLYAQAVADATGQPARAILLKL